ncbi:MAG TPA: vWA domain-containing protein [Polyangiaceae bacterium]|nr:vWA domain-containing protein [Polyangiaceae bacterium]
MTTLRTFFGLVPFVLAPLAACSAGSKTDNSGLTGDGGSSATGGTGISLGGGTNTGGSSAQGGSGGGIDVSGSSGTGASAAMQCDPLDAVSTRLVPTVLILVDNSSSMFEPLMNGTTTAWSLLYDALMDPTSGVVKPLENDIRFGFSSFKGLKGTSEADPACAIMTPAMPTFMTGNYDAINQIYTELGMDTGSGQKWETPTGHAIDVVTPALVAYDTDPPGPKYILLVTDGNPNTCQTVDPQCGQDRTIKAVQDAYAQGVGTLIVGIGDIVEQPNDGCNATQSRCGDEHLQDVANAGAGLPVQAPPSDYQYQPCVQGETGGMFTATYATAGQTPGAAPFFESNDPDVLRTGLAKVLSAVQTCTFDLTANVTGNPALANVTLDGNPLTYGDMAAGWILEDNKHQITLEGSACDNFRSNPGSALHASFPCDMGKPIAEPR